MDLEKIDANGDLVVPVNAHARITRPDQNGGAAMLRRPFSYHDGIGADGTPDAGLLFVCWQADPLRGFVPVQRKLDRGDALSHVHPARVERPVRGAGRRGRGGVRGAAAAGGVTAGRGVAGGRSRPRVVGVGRRAPGPARPIRVRSCQRATRISAPRAPSPRSPCARFPEAATRELIPMVSVPAALDAVRSGEAEAAFVPIENSVEGGITTTLDELVAGSR